MQIKDTIQLYRESRRSDVRDSTLQSHVYRIRRWVEFCDVQGIEDTNDIQKIHFEQFKQHRRDQDKVAKATLKGQMDTLRVYLKTLERVGLIDDGLHESVPSVTLRRKDEVNNRIVPDDEARAILEILDRYHYATQKHVYFLLSWRTSARISSLRALDVEDFQPDERYLYYREREGTKLKNGLLGERPVALSQETTEILKDYLSHHRYEVKDQHERHPLLTTKSGRVSKNTLRRWCYTLTCPSFRGEECDCDESAKSGKCSNSVSPHGIRRGSITYFLRQGAPEQVVSDRANVSKDVLSKHYDKRNPTEKMEQRRVYLENI